jgi:hypothetical protein
MGLHRDGTHYGLSHVEIHVRRILWYQLCFLDIRTCEATGPRPQIRREDFDTRLPLNVNDIDLESSNPPTEDCDQWTDMTLSLIRFDCYEMHRYVWKERPRLQEMKITLTQVLGKIQDFIHASEQKYLPMMNKNIPIQYMGILSYRIMTYRMHVMVLHRYVTTDLRPMPDRLRKIVLSSGVQQVECAILIETAPPLKQWAWYLGAFNQYHATMMLLAELYSTDQPYFEDRIWHCVDFAFELPPNAPRREKAKHVFLEVAEKTHYYQLLRKIRTPKPIEDAMIAMAKMRNLTYVPDLGERPSHTDGIPHMEFKNAPHLPEIGYYGHEAAQARISPGLSPSTDSKLQGTDPTARVSSTADTVNGSLSEAYERLIVGRKEWNTPFTDLPTTAKEHESPPIAMKAPPPVPQSAKVQMDIDWVRRGYCT